MTRFPSTILLYVNLALWLVPSFGKKLAPAVFGSAGVQWGSALLMAVLVPVAALASVTRPPAGDRLRVAWLHLAMVLSPLVITLVIQAVMIPMLSRVASKLAADEASRILTISKVREKATNASSGAIRERAAWMTYRISGVPVDWLKDDGSTQTFVPSDEDRAKWEDLRLTNESGLSAGAVVDWQLQQTRWLFFLNLVSLGVTIVVLVRRKMTVNAVRSSALSEN